MTSTKLFIGAKVERRLPGSTLYIPLHTADNKLLLSTDLQVVKTYVDAAKARHYPEHSYTILCTEVQHDGSISTYEVLNHV